MAASSLASVVVTVRDEARHIRDLLDSLLPQEPPWEVIVVDGGSRDSTPSIVRSYASRHPEVRLVVHPSSRGEARNLGVEKAEGDFLLFTDGDCIANVHWIREMRRALETSEVAAGRTVPIGYWAFEGLHRVELQRGGFDVTFPSCNLGYRREVFEKIGGFDPSFVTAEDIDLNLRAVDSGAHISYAPEAIIYHRVRDSGTSFFRQAFWNGYGRKQLTLKHGSLWGAYSFQKLFETQMTFWGVARLVSASLGYLAATVRERRGHGR